MASIWFCPVKAASALGHGWLAPIAWGPIVVGVVLTLALSVGVATAVFCVIDAVILRPLPYANPDKIVSVESSSKSGYTQPASWPSYQDERAQAKGFAALAEASPHSGACLSSRIQARACENSRSANNHGRAV